MINFCIEFCTNTISNSKNEDVILKKNNILSLVELKNKILTITNNNEVIYSETVNSNQSIKVNKNEIFINDIKIEFPFSPSVSTLYLKNDLIYVALGFKNLVEIDDRPLPVDIQIKNLNYAKHNVHCYDYNGNLIWRSPGAILPEQEMDVHQSSNLPMNFTYFQRIFFDDINRPDQVFIQTLEGISYWLNRYTGEVIERLHIFMK